MYDGSLYGRWEALVTMQQLIVLADEQGVIDMTPPAIAGKTSIPLEIIERGLEILAAPDPYTRTPGHDGVRIKLMDDHRPWGWYIVNYKQYRDMVRREDKLRADRERIAAKREKDKKINDVAECRILSHSVANVAHTDTDTDTDTKKSNGHYVTAFDDFWAVYPRKRKKKTARDIWMRKRPDAAVLIADVRNRLANDARWLAGFVPDPTTYLNGERWHDEVEAVKKDGAKTTADYAAELGLTQNPNESDDLFKRRVRDAIVTRDYQR